jgi:hypothetical protein
VKNPKSAEEPPSTLSQPIAPLRWNSRLVVSQALAGRTLLPIYFFLAVIMTIVPHIEEARSQSDEVEHALDTCRQLPRTITLNDDRTVLCFDGPIEVGMNLSVSHRLKERGTFVMRSPGGYDREAMLLSNILREKDALVILYDYCLSACANYVLVANRTYVAKDTIVAWHGGRRPTVTAEKCRGEGLKFLREDLAPYYGPDTNRAVDDICETDALHRTFFQERGMDNRHALEPQTYYTRKMVKLISSEQIDRTRVFWMWNPKNYGDSFKSRVSFVSYPQSQDEVDSLASKLRLGVRIVFDPVCGDFCGGP